MNSHRIRQQLLAMTLPAGWFLSPAASAQSTWNGTVSSDWANAANWSAGVPASAADVTIADTTGGANALNLDSPRTIGSLTFGTTGNALNPSAVNKDGANTLTLSAANTYSGDTIVSDGTVSPSQPFFNDTAAIRLSGDGTVDLFHEQTDIVGRLFINGLPQAIGLWGRVGSIAALGANFESPLITGDGLLRVTASGTPFDKWAVDSGLTAGVNDDPEDNPDLDDLDNLGEFALDGNPLSGLSSGRVVVKVASVGGEQVLTLTLPVRAAVGAFAGPDALTATGDGVTYIIEGSDNLAAWLLDIDEVTGADATAIQSGLPALSNADWVYRSFRSPGTITGDPSEFMRVRIE